MKYYALLCIKINNFIVQIIIHRRKYAIKIQKSHKYATKYYLCRDIKSKHMEVVNLLHFAKREELRQWFEKNHTSECCCWVVMYRTKRPEWDAIAYIDVVEEALCFGWIDSTMKRLPDGRLVQRLSPRRKGSHWTELNKQRCADLEKRGLMTDAGRKEWERALKI